MVPTSSKIFRDLALEYHFGSRHRDGDLLRISPRWTNSMYWLLMGLFVAGSIYAVFGTIDEYASGIAVVRNERRTAVTALTAGTVAQIAVKPGQHVSLNEPLVHFIDTQERIELSHLEDEVKLQEINRLKSPNDPAPVQQLASLRAEIETSTKRLNCRTVLAPQSGIVRDVRIRPNQLIAVGELLLTIVEDSDPLSVIAILPGQYRPLLRVGNPLRFELAGFRYAYQPLTIDSVGNEVVGPAEVRRFIGQEIGDSLMLQGPSVIVQARLPSRRFQADGNWCEFHDGMQGRIEARLRSNRILLSLVPALEAVSERRHE